MNWKDIKQSLVREAMLINIENPREFTSNAPRTNKWVHSKAVGYKANIQTKQNYISIY